MLKFLIAVGPEQFRYNYVNGPAPIKFSHVAIPFNGNLELIGRVEGSFQGRSVAVRLTNNLTPTLYTQFKEQGLFRSDNLIFLTKEQYEVVENF